MLVHDVHAERLATLSAATGARALDAITDHDLNGLAALVMCVKPQDLLVTATPLRGRVGARTLVVSLLAGVPMADVAAALGHAGPVVRAMPNICATVCVRRAYVVE